VPDKVYLEVVKAEMPMTVDCLAAGMTAAERISARRQAAAA